VWFSKISLATSGREQFCFMLSDSAHGLIASIFLYSVKADIDRHEQVGGYDLKNEIFLHYQSLPLSFYRRKQYRRLDESD